MKEWKKEEKKATKPLDPKTEQKILKRALREEMKKNTLLTQENSKLEERVKTSEQFAAEIACQVSRPRVG